jgi:hypothetical protein
MPTNLALISELEAVNVGLAAAGATPITTFENNQPDVLSMRALLISNSKELQARGWWFNREYTISLAPDAQGRVIVPQNALSVDSVDPSDNFTVRGAFLYDRDNATTVISRSIVIDSITFLVWEELPFIAQNAIQYQAALDFVGGDDGDADEVIRLEAKFNKAFAELKRHNLRNEDITVRTNLTVSRVMARRRNRVTTRFGGAAR